MTRLFLTAGIIAIFSFSAQAEFKKEELKPQLAEGREGYATASDMAEHTTARAMQDGYTNASSSVERVATNIKEDMYATTEKLYDWLLTPPVKKQPRAIPHSYCYKSFQDILCYRQPVPGWEHRIVGYQGTGAKAPPPSITKLLPMRNDEQHQEAEMRVKTAEPVFSEVPKEEKKDESQNGDTNLLIPDPMNQAIPTSINSPQL